MELKTKSQAQEWAKKHWFATSSTRSFSREAATYPYYKLLVHRTLQGMGPWCNVHLDSLGKGWQKLVLDDPCSPEPGVALLHSILLISGDARDH